MSWKVELRIIVATGITDNKHVVSSPSKGNSQIAGMLGSRSHVREKGLIKD